MCENINNGENMKKLVSVLGLSTLLTVGAIAHGVEAHEEKSDFYVAVKGIVTLGDSIDEETAKLEGGLGKGLGIDLGYVISHGFSVEVDGTYVRNTVKETVFETGDVKYHDATYITTSLDVVYKYMVTSEFAILLKGGYEYEFEKIPDLDVDKTLSGFVYAGALIYEVTEGIEVLAEYEVTTIKGPRGNSAFAGVEFSF